MPQKVEMKRPAISLLVAGLLCLSISAASFAKEPLKYSLRAVTSKPLVEGYRGFVADMDGDGRDEFFLDRGVALTGLRLHGNEWIPFDEWKYREAGIAIGFCDATGDGLPELFVFSKVEKGQSLACYGLTARDRGSPLYAFGPFLPERERRTDECEGTLNFMGCFDADGDGRPAVYFGIDPYHHEPVPRSLRVCDGDTGDSLWAHDLGPQTKICLPVESNSGPLIALSTFACYNGASWNGTSDSLSYVLCFQPNGKPVWGIPVTGPLGWGVIDTMRCAADGHQKILVGIYYGPSEIAEPTWSVAILDPNDGSLYRSRSLGTGIADVKAADLDGDGIQEVLAIGTDGRFYILNNDLSERAKKQDRLHLQPARGITAVVDLDGDGYKEIVLCGANGVLVRDGNGNLIAEEELLWPYLLEVAAEEQSRYIAAQSNNMVTFFALERLPSRFTVGQIAALVFGCIGFGAGAGFSGIALRRWLKWRRIAMAYLDEARYDLLMAMTAFGHGGASMRIIDRLRFLLINWEEMRKTILERGGVLAELIGAFKETVAPDLRQIVFLSRKAKIPREHWRDMVPRAEKAGKALTAILGEKAGPSSSDETAEAAEAVSALDALEKGIAGIRAELRSIFRTTILSSLGRIVSGREGELGAIGCSPKIHVADAQQASVFISPGAFEKIVDGIVSNAIRAMKQRDCPELEISVTSEGAQCVIDVRDNGQGIAESDRERIFDRSYTTKEKGGFGLYYSRKELAKFGGKIFVLESSPDGGSAFRIVLQHA
ncbi:MAG: hypothetical protein C4574_02835 [Candidatus Latescibacterota bacterium]|jgi:signal transduction histidine kinase|nr:MAG: hypothetical protein C4574_02835 [Candidatus Latescibacterota bacterium]